MLLHVLRSELFSDRIDVDHRQVVPKVLAVGLGFKNHAIVFQLVALVTKEELVFRSIAHHHLSIIVKRVSRDLVRIRGLTCKSLRVLPYTLHKHAFFDLVIEPLRVRIHKAFVDVKLFLLSVESRQLLHLQVSASKLYLAALQTRLGALLDHECVLSDDAGSAQELAHSFLRLESAKACGTDDCFTLVTRDFEANMLTIDALRVSVPHARKFNYYKKFE